MNAVAHQHQHTYSFHDHQIRVVIRDGEPWFVASDLTAALCLDRTAYRKLDADEKGVHSMHTPGGPQEIAVVSEAGMYTLVLRCRDAVIPGTTPYSFRKWVTSEVIPSIRKTGSYQHPHSHPAVLRDVPAGYVLVEEALIHDLQKGADLVINLRALLEGLSKLADSKGTDFLGGMTMLLDGAGMRASADRVRQANFRHCGRPAGTALQP